MNTDGYTATLLATLYRRWVRPTEGVIMISTSFIVPFLVTWKLNWRINYIVSLYYDMLVGVATWQVVTICWWGGDLVVAGGDDMLVG